MRLWRLNIVALFELSQPNISFLGSHMQPIGVVGSPRFERIMSKRLALFFTRDIWTACDLQEVSGAGQTFCFTARIHAIFSGLPNFNPLHSFLMAAIRSSRVFISHDAASATSMGSIP